MLPLAAIPLAEIIAGVVGAAIAHQLMPKKISLDVEFD